MVRIKHRYLLLNVLYPDTALSTSAVDAPDFLKFHASTPQDVNSQRLKNHLVAHIATSFGDQGLGLCQASLKMIYWSNATSTAIIRVPRAHYQVVWASLSYMTQMPQGKGPHSTTRLCVVRVVRVSGTIRKAEEELLRRSRKHIVQAKLAGVENHDTVLNRIAGVNDIASTSHHRKDEHDHNSSIVDDDDDSVSET